MKWKLIAPGLYLTQDNLVVNRKGDTIHDRNKMTGEVDDHEKARPDKKASGGWKESLFRSKQKK